MVNPNLLVRPQDFHGFNPANRDRLAFETPKLAVVAELWIRFGISAFEIAPHILAVDLSHWNGDVIWRLLRESGVIAVILKVSEGAEGTYYEYKDEKFEIFWKSALDWGFPVILYHFFRGEKGSQEFSWFMKCADAFLHDPQILGHTAVYLDCEWKPSTMALSTYTNRAFGFTDSVRGAGMKNGIYCSPGLVPQLFDPAIARWNTVKQWNAHWTSGKDTLPVGWSEENRNIHQRGIYPTHWWAEKVEGAGKVDINYMFYANELELRYWLGQIETSPSASPSPSPSSSPSPSYSSSSSSSASPSQPDCCEELRIEIWNLTARMDMVEAQLADLNALVEKVREALCE